jgi:hypothetical protein
MEDGRGLRNEYLSDEVGQRHKGEKERCIITSQEAACCPRRKSNSTHLIELSNRDKKQRDMASAVGLPRRTSGSKFILLPLSYCCCFRTLQEQPMLHHHHHHHPLPPSSRLPALFIDPRAAPPPPHYSHSSNSSSGAAALLVLLYCVLYPAINRSMVTTAATRTKT